MQTRHDLAPPAVPTDTPWTRDDALVTIGAAAVDLVGYSLSGQSDGESVTVVGCALIVASALCLLARNRRPVLTLAAVLALAVALNLSTSVPHHSGFRSALVVALYAVARAHARKVIVPTALTAAVVPLLGQPDKPVPTPWEVLGNMLAAALVVATATAVNRWHENVETQRRLLADRAVADERRRIARELHDIVSHHITTMQLMAGGARANLAHDTDVVRDALVTLEESGRMALREMRQLLDVLRADDEPEDALSPPQPGTADLGRIVAESRLAGLPTEFTVHGQERPLPPSVGLTVFRIVQEALTNARKHAEGARVQVELTYRQNMIVVEIHNDGTGAPQAAVAAGGRGRKDPGRTGYGLIGMRERVALHGGTLETGALDGGGFRVAAGLPLTPSTSEADQAEELLR
ncbi:sensor histidine kinase [Streptomyces sp. CBMA152]|uniref:sensor histidine kinase n=1 Tax=Streptomyces sp. CBMA152 TaxID=1896312 RepID=UPI0016616059|nr:sensor histidine kinase [Streptomyces sp. CBMA152]MBD0746793.1 hypothetical protein [Streptomyces sp. CBMA152]